MDKKYRYVITFKKKEHINYVAGHYEKISDGKLIESLNKLQTNFDCEIIKFGLGGTYDDSRVVLRCAKKDIMAIISAFSDEVGYWIKHVTVKRRIF